MSDTLTDLLNAAQRVVDRAGLRHPAIDELRERLADYAVEQEWGPAGDPPPATSYPGALTALDERIDRITAVPETIENPPLVVELYPGRFSAEDLAGSPGHCADCKFAVPNGMRLDGLDDPYRCPRIARALMLWFAPQVPATFGCVLWERGDARFDLSQPFDWSHARPDCSGQAGE